MFDTANMATTSLGIFFLASFVEGTVTYLTTPPKGEEENAFIKKIKPFRAPLALVLGVGLALAYGIDIPASVFDLNASWVGMLISGVAIGRGSNYLNDMISLVRIKTSSSNNQ